MASDAMALDEPAPVQPDRPKKRPRRLSVAAPPDGAVSTAPRLFAPFRALGLITNHIPFVLQTRSYKGSTEGPRVHILTCLGRGWALWEGGKMNVLFVGTEAEHNIDALAMDGDDIWAAAGKWVINYRRGKEVKRAENPLETTLSNIMIFGKHLLALTADGRHLLTWSTENEEKKTDAKGRELLLLPLVSSLAFASDFTATTFVHPSTYINKILVASAQGTAQLWNIQTKMLIHAFSYENLSDIAHEVGPRSVSCVVQSPAIDVIGFGFASGEIVLHDVRADERLMRMWQEGGGVRALAFRGDGQPVLASASSAGHITLWDLSERGRLLHILRGAHDAAVTGLEWIPGQPVLVSSGEDNSVKQWFFESPTAPPTLLKYRSGHFSPPHLVRYYGSDGKALLSASRDRSVRYTSVVRDTRSTELSQGHLAKKATSLSVSVASLKYPPVTGLSFSTTRTKDWDDLLTTHQDESFARTWSVQNKKLGKHKLPVHAETSKGTIGKKRNPKTVQGGVKAVHVSACGNFGLAANSKGVIGMWNMQSGIRRKSFSLPPSSSALKTDRSVVGLATDALNKVVIVATLDGTINFFDFHSTQLQSTVTVPSSISAILLQRDSGLLVVTCDDHSIRLFDIETQKLAREFTGFEGRILDVDISSDSRWLIVASMDSIIRTYDIPTGRLIDAFKTSSLATSLAFSPTGDFLATTHVDTVGIYLWANRSQFTEVSFRGLNLANVNLNPVNLPAVEGEVEEDLLPDLSSLTVQETQDVFTSPKQLEGSLITLTLLPRERWQTLIKLDIVQARNKPKQPPKAPEKAPFFLPTLPGIEHRFDTAKASTTTGRADEPGVSKKGKKKSTAGASSELQLKLRTEARDGPYDELFDYIKLLSPAAIDLEIRTLVLLEDLSTFLHALQQRLRSHRDFEAVQSLLSVFLRLHGETILKNRELHEVADKLMEVQKSEGRRILELVTSSIGILNFVRDIG